MQVLTSSRARNFAETRWGRGGTKAYRTNRRGAYYFTCSGHGGYVVDGHTLTGPELYNIDRYIKPEKCLLVYNTTTQRIIFLSNPFTMRTQKYRFNPDTQSIYHDYPIYVFEEDCDWAVLETFTDIRAKGIADPVVHEAEIKRVFDHWFAGKKIA